MDAKIMSKFSSYDEELKVNVMEDDGVYASGEKIKKYISNMEDEDLEKFVIVKSKLLYIGIDEKESKIAENLGLGSGSSDSSDAGATIKEIQKIVDNVVEVSEENKSKIPTSDDDRLDEKEHFNDSEGLIGLRLFDRSGENLINGTWNILIEYDTQNSETARYGTGYYWLRGGKTYIIGGEEIPFKNDYVINYGKGEYEVLSGRAVNWNVNATLGVTDNIALNLDPMSLANGNWENNSLEGDFDDFIITKTNGERVNTGIQRTGDVKYDGNDKSLSFNEENGISESNKGYLKLKKDNLDFLDGFTFEIYGNLDKLDDGIGFFSRRPSINSDYTRAMRFHMIPGDGIGRFGPYSEICFPESVGNTGKIYTREDGFIHADDDFYQIKEKTDFYMTVVFRSASDNEADQFMKEKDCYRYEYYLNGKLIDYTYYGKSGYTDGLDVWNNDNCPFFVGICCWSGDSNNFFYYGKMYSVRLYQGPIRTDQVKLNYDMTLKYRDSFKND